MFLEKPGVESESYYDKISIKEDRKLLVSPNQNIKQKGKQEEDDNEEKDDDNEEKDDDEEKEEEATGKMKSKKEAFKEFIEYMFRIMLNWPEDDFDEDVFKKKINERFYTYVNEKEKEVDDFIKWKDQCLKFRKWFGEAEFNGKKDIKTYQKEWKNKINS